MIGKFSIVFFLLFVSFFLNEGVFAEQICKKKIYKHNEASYQNAWCDAHNGIAEYENSDKTRVDCLTQEYAVEFDFAKKWAESIGQALHYGLMTGKKPMVVLILENPEKQMCYFERVKKIGEKYCIKTEFVTNEILMRNSEGKCTNPQCKCQK